MRLIPQERIQQRTVEQIVVVSSISSRQRNGGSGPDHRRQNCQCDSGGTTPNTNHPDNLKTVEVLQIQFLDRVVDVPVDEHTDDSCDYISDFQMEVVSKEKCARSLMTVSLICV